MKVTDITCPVFLLHDGTCFHIIKTKDTSYCKLGAYFLCEEWMKREKAKAQTQEAKGAVKSVNTP